MLRRQFLQLSTVAASWLMLPSQVQAASNYRGPLWIFIHASGGWDPTSLCDPKANNLTAPQGGPMNSFSPAQVNTVAGTNISYANLTSNEGYSFSTFFEKYGQDLLVVNGIDAQTNGHSSGTRYVWSGNLSRQTPSMGALFASSLLAESPLALIHFGGYDFTGGLVPATRLSNSGTTSLIEKLAYPNKSGSSSFYSDDIFSYIKSSSENRTSSLSRSTSFSTTANELDNFSVSNIQSEKLKYFHSFLTGTTPSGGMRERARLAMASYRAGLTSSLNLSIGGFDTHSNHEINHIRQLGRLLDGIDDIVAEATSQGMKDSITIVVGSEFGRTRGYNNNDVRGKDHWPVSSMMFMGAGIRGGRTIGATTDVHKVKSINPNTLELDPNGINMTPAHINKALRKLAGLGSNGFINQNFPINVEDLDLFS